MKKIINKAASFLKDERGLSSAEVAIIAGFLAVTAALLGGYLSQRIQDAGNRIGDRIDNAAK